MVGDRAGIGRRAREARSPDALPSSTISIAPRERETADALGARSRVERIVVIIGGVGQVDVLIVASTRARCAHARAIDRRIAYGAPRRPSRAVRAQASPCAADGRDERLADGAHAGFFLCPREGGLREAIGATTASRADGKTVDAV